MTKEVKELINKFKCPHCGNEEILIKPLINTYMKPEKPIVYKAYRIELFDKSKVKAGDSVSFLELFYDICSKCGTEYCYEVNKINFTIPEEEKKEQKKSNIVLPGIRPKNLNIPPFMRGG